MSHSNQWRGFQKGQRKQHHQNAVQTLGKDWSVKWLCRDSKRWLHFLEFGSEGNEKEKASFLRNNLVFDTDWYDLSLKKYNPFTIHIKWVLNKRTWGNVLPLWNLPRHLLPMSIVRIYLEPRLWNKHCSHRRHCACPEGRHTGCRACIENLLYSDIFSTEKLIDFAWHDLSGNLQWLLCDILYF